MKEEHEEAAVAEKSLDDAAIDDTTRSAVGDQLESDEGAVRTLRMAGSRSA
jgi:hypothetical protein